MTALSGMLGKNPETSAMSADSGATDSDALASSVLMDGRVGVVMGVANRNSIAWHICQSLHQHGAKLGLSYQKDALLRRLDSLTADTGADIIGECDINDDAAVDAFFSKVQQKYGAIDFLVHSIAYAEQEDLNGRFIDTGRRGFQTALESSAYSLVRVVRAAEPLLRDNSAILTLTYLGARRVVGSYGVMGVAKAALESSVRYLAVDLGARGIRINALSAGPVRTLAARVIGDAGDIYRWQSENSPLERNITGEDVGSSAVYLLSDWAKGVTATVHHVDAGYHVTAGLKP